MEYIEGLPIDEFCNAHTLSVPERLKLFREVCAAVSYAQPANESLQFYLANTCNQLGNGLKATNDLPGAIEQHRTAASICERLLSSKPSEQRFRRALGSSYENMANALELQGDAAGAMEANQKARMLVEGLVTEDPLNVDYRRGLVLSYKLPGDLLIRSDTRGALEYYRKATESAEQVVAADPADVARRRDLAGSHKRMAEVLARLKDNAEALSHFGKALDIYDKLATTAPADLTFPLMAAICRAGVAGMHARLGEVDHALGESAKTVALLAGITDDGTAATQRAQKAQAYEYLGYAYNALATSPKASPTEARQHTTTARDMFRQALDILDDLRSRHALEGVEDWAKEVAGEIAKCGAGLEK